MTCKQDREERRKLYSERGKELNRRIKTLSFNEKVKLSKDAIRNALQDHGGNPVISSSFGKDSMALTHLVHSVRPGVCVVFTRTGQQFPGTIQYMKRMQERYGLDIIELHPEKTFWEIVRDNGYPRTSRNSKTGDKREPACCQILKFKPFKKFASEFRPSLNFVGLVGDEGRQRRMPFLINGSVTYHNKELDMWKSVPILWWTGADVWRYHDENGIPRNPVYEKYGIERTGCMACTGHLNWQEQIQRVSFPLYQKVARESGNPTIEDFMKLPGGEVNGM